MVASLRTSKAGTVSTDDSAQVTDINSLGGALIGYDTETGASLTVGGFLTVLTAGAVTLPVPRILKVEAEINMSAVTTTGQFQVTLQMAIGGADPFTVARRDFGYNPIANSIAIQGAASCLLYLNAGTYTFSCEAGRSATDSHSWFMIGAATQPNELRVWDVGPQF